MSDFKWGKFGGHLGMYGSIFDCHTYAGGVTGILWVEIRDAVKHPTMHKAAPQQRIIQLSISTVPRLRNFALE